MEETRVQRQAQCYMTVGIKPRAALRRNEERVVFSVNSPGSTGYPHGRQMQLGTYFHISFRVGQLISVVFVVHPMITC